MREGVFPNVDFNYRNGDNNNEYYMLDELLYKERFTIERTNAWMDSFRTILNRLAVKGNLGSLQEEVHTTCKRNRPVFDCSMVEKGLIEETENR